MRLTPASHYRVKASELAQKGASQFGVIAFTADKSTPEVYDEKDVATATAKYDALAEKPGDYIYIALNLDHTLVMEYDVLGGKQTEKKSGSWKWILGGVGVGIALLMASRK